MRLTKLNKLLVLIRDNWTCQYCRVKADTELDRARLTVDHVIPKSRGGTNHDLNLVAACKDCNHRKGSVIFPGALRKMDKRVQEYVKKLQAKVFNHEVDRP